MSSHNSATPSRSRASGASGASASASPSAPPPPSTAVPSNQQQQQGQQGQQTPSANMRKRRNHRGGKKKRRKSFAVTGPSLSSIGGSVAGSVDNDDEPVLHEDVEADPLKDAYRRTPGRPGRSLSSTSIDSEGLLRDHRDHRDLREQHQHQQQQPFLRARRPSVVVVPAASVSSGGRHRASLHMNDDDDDEGAPLLSRSYVGTDPPGYGTNNAIGNDNGNVPMHTGSGHSSPRHSFLNPFATASNINYPPSVPGTPPMRPTSRLLELNHSHGNNLSFGDQMLRDELRSPSSPTLRRSDTSSSKINLLRTSNDTLLENRDRERDRDSRERGDQSRDHDRGREGSIGSASRRSGGHPGIHSVSGGGGGVGGGAEGENDVCFPHKRGGNDDDDIHSHRHYNGYDDEDHQSHNDDGRDTTWRSRPSRRRRVKWPDLAILDEWSRFERESKEDGLSNGRRRAKKIKEPQLINGRLRPVHKGWHRAEEDAPYRFTYFNEEFQSTIHSQTISELVQPGGSYRELFIPDPPVLSDSEDSEEEYNNGGFPEVDDAGLHGDAFSPTALMGHATNVNSNSGGTVSPVKQPSFGSGTLSGTGTPRLVRGASVPLERTATQTSEHTSVFRSPPRMAPPGMTQSGAMTPDVPPLTLSPTPGTPRQEAVGAVVTMAPVVVPIMADGTSGMPVAASRIQPQSRSQSRSQSQSQPQLQSQSPPKVKQPRYGERPVWWLDVLSPTEAEMKVLSKAFGIHPLTAEDIIMQEAREKVELFHHYYFVSYRSFDQDPSSETFLDPVNVYVVVFREGVLSFHFSMTPHPANVRRRIRQLSDYMILSSDWISYAIIDDITDVFVPLIQKIEEEVDDIDDAILEMHSGGLVQEKKEEGAASAASATAEADTNMLLRVGDCRKRVMSLYRLLGNKADVIKGFAKRCNEHWEVAPRSEIGLYLGDIQDHIVTMTSNLSHYEKILSRAHGNYLAQINIRMNERQEQTADVLGRLTVLGTIVLPMNIITGLWGMNVWVPGQDVEGNLWWFTLITAGLFAFGMACYMIAKRVYKIV